MSSSAPPDRTLVYVVEWRQRAYHDLDDCLVVHIASSKERALAWCLANLDYEQQDSESPWLFAVTAEGLDDPHSYTELVAWVSWDGDIRTDDAAAPSYYLDASATKPASAPPAVD
jgi:hypothetical protein